MLLYEAGNLHMCCGVSPALQVVASREDLVKEDLACFIIDAHHLQGHMLHARQDVA